MFAIVFPNISPYYFKFADIELRWYGLVYAFSLFLAPYLFLKLLKIKKIGHYVKNISYFKEKIIFSASLGVLLGGRLGYAFLYDTELWSQNNWEIIRIWEGGMAFHGAVLGLLFALIYVAHSEKIPLLLLLDLTACIAPTALFFGRLSNFVNAELYGRPTELPWGVIFPHSDGLPRHPSQLYEALSEGLLLQLILAFCFIRYWSNNKKQPNFGLLCGVFCIFYSIFRICSEFFRQPEIIILITRKGIMQIDNFGSIVPTYQGVSITLGQALCLPLLLAGIAILIVVWRQRQKNI